MFKPLARVLVLLTVTAFLTVGAFSQNMTFTAESPTIAPGSPGCVQVGLFVDVSPGAMTPGFSGLVATVEYSADPGVLLTGTAPFARISSFAPVAEVGLSNPPTPQGPHSTGGGLFMSPCSPDITTNSVVLTGGSPISFIGGMSMAMVSEDVNPMNRRITLTAAGADFFVAGSRNLFAVVTFPVSGAPGAIRLNFVNPMPGSNALIDQNEMVVSVNTAPGILQVAGSTAVPTLSQWGIFAFLTGLLVSALLFLRRRSIAD